MSLSDLLFVLPVPPAVSVVLWAIVLLVLLYLGREPFKQATLALGQVLHKVFRLAARSVGIAEQKLSARNREVLLATGREETERHVEREFHRISAAVNRDLTAYPELHRALSEQIQKIDEGFRASAEAVAEPPGWIEAVEAVATMRDNASPRIAGVLEDIHKSLVAAQKEATAEYRRAAAERHKVLARMSPSWRRIETTLGEVKGKIEGLLDRSKRIDRHMDDFEQINNGTDRAVQTLSSSSVTQFFIAGLVIAIAFGGALVNFYLIARPMQEMVGGTAMLGPFPMSDVAAMVIIFVELSMGLFLMESLRITRLFPVIGAMDDRKRFWMMIVTFAFLTILATLESMLGLMREVLASQDADLIRALTSGGGEPVIGTMEPGGPRTIPLVVHMVLSFILPFALAFVAIPLESFIHSGRTVLGLVLVGLLRGLRGALRMLGAGSIAASRFMNRIYDLVIFLPLWIEGAAFPAGFPRRGTTPATDAPGGGR